MIKWIRNVNALLMDDRDDDINTRKYDNEFNDTFDKMKLTGMKLAIREDASNDNEAVLLLDCYEIAMDL